MKKRLIGWIPYFLLVLIVALKIIFASAIEGLQLKVFDVFQRLKPRNNSHAPVRIIDIDDDSLAKLGQWPWPRTLLAKLITRLQEHEVAAIGMDIVFAEPDRTSPVHLLNLLPAAPDTENLRQKLQEMPDHDQIFARAIQEAPVVTAFNLTPEVKPVRPVLKAGIAYGGENPVMFLPFFSGAVVNLAEIEAAAKGNGSFSIVADDDGLIRRIPLLYRLQDTLYPSLAAESLRIAQGASSYKVKSSGASGVVSFGEKTGITSVQIGTRTVPTDAQGRIWLYDSGYRKERFLPVWKILEGLIPEEELAGAIVFLGTSAAGLKDLRATPLNPVAAGVEIHAQITEQMIEGTFLNRPDWAEGAELIYFITLALLLIFLLPRLGAAWCALAAGSVTAGVFGFSWYAFSVEHLLLDPLWPSAAVGIIYFAVSLISYLRTEAERREVRDAFGRYLSPALVEQLADHPEKLKLGGEIKNMTLLFADIRGFTALSEKLEAGELTQLLNRFLTLMTDLILKQNGTIDKYMGDCIMAFWNAPLDDPDHARHACRAALLMREEIVRWNARPPASADDPLKVFPAIQMGIGLNTGDCCVGNMGSEQRFDYSALGDEVNLSSRLEGQSKYYGVDIVLGENTCQRAGEDFAALEIDRIRVKGKVKPVTIYTLLGDKTLKEDAAFRQLQQAHDQMLEAYRTQKWETALHFAKECRKLDGEKTRLQKFYEVYLSRIESYQAHSPGEAWDGVFVATTK